MSNANLNPDYEFVAYCFEAFARYAKSRSPSDTICKSSDAAVQVAADTKSLKSLLTDTSFPRLLDHIRRGHLVAPGNIREVCTQSVDCQVLSHFVYWRICLLALQPGGSRATLPLPDRRAVGTHQVDSGRVLSAGAQRAEADCGPEGLPEGLLDQQSAHSLFLLHICGLFLRLYWRIFISSDRCSWCFFSPIMSTFCTLPFPLCPQPVCWSAARLSRGARASALRAVRRRRGYAPAARLLRGLLLRSAILFAHC